MVFGDISGGAQIPFFIFVIFLMAYISWSKFLNGNELKIKNANQLLDILIIFFCLLSTISGIVLLLLGIFSIINMNFDLSVILFISPYFILIITILLFIIFLISYPKKSNKKDFTEAIKSIMTIQFLFLIMSGIFFIILIFTPLGVVLSESIFFILFVYGVSIIISWFLIWKGFNFSFLNLVNKDFLVFCAVIAIIFLVVILSSIPLILNTSTNILNYKINNLNSDFEEAYKITNSETKIINQGIGLIPILVLDYGKSNYLTETESQRKEFSISFLTKNSSEKFFLAQSFEDLISLKKDNKNVLDLEDILVDEERKIIILKHSLKDRKFLKNVEKFFIIGATKWVPEKENFEYWDNSKDQDICEGEICLLKFHLKNNLPAPLVISRREIFDLRNRGIENISDCEFKEIIPSIKHYNKTTRDGTSCHGNYCELRIYNGESKKQIIQMPLELKTEEEEISSNYDWYINDTIDLEITAFLSCTIHNN